MTVLLKAAPALFMTPLGLFGRLSGEQVRAGRLFHRGCVWTFERAGDLKLSGSTGCCPGGVMVQRAEIPGERPQQAGLGTGGGECQADARDGFEDAGAELEEPEPQRGELGFAEMMGCGHRLAQGEHQPVCGGVQDEADLVGDRRTAAGAVGGKLALVHL